MSKGKFYKAAYWEPNNVVFPIVVREDERGDRWMYLEDEDLEKLKKKVEAHSHELNIIKDSIITHRPFNVERICYVLYKRD